MADVITRQDLENARTDVQKLSQWANGGAGTLVDFDGTAVRSPAKLISDYAAQFAAMGLYLFRGDWTTATVYAVRDIIVHSGDFYVVAIAHTSDVFATDLAANKLQLNDIVSRAELADPDTGSGRIGHTTKLGVAGTVKDALDALDTGDTHVLGILGQSQGVGRADDPIYGDAFGHVFTRVFKLTRRVATYAFEVLNPADYTQNVNGGPGQHGIEPYIGYLFEKEFPNDELYIINYSYGGIGIAYRDGSTATPPEADPPTFSPLTINSHYSWLVDYITNGLTLAPGTKKPAGLIFLGGETAADDDGKYNSDAHEAEEHYDDLVTLFDTLAVDVPATKKYGRYIAGVATSAPWDFGARVYLRQAKYCTGSFGSYSYALNDSAIPVLLRTIDLPRIGDNLHYGNSGFELLAKRAMRAMFGVGGDNYAPNVPPYVEINDYPIFLTAATTPPTAGPQAGVVRLTTVGRQVTAKFKFAAANMTGAVGNLIVTGSPLRLQDRQFTSARPVGVPFGPTAFNVTPGTPDTVAVVLGQFTVMHEADSDTCYFLSEKNDGSEAFVNVTSASGIALEFTISGDL